FPQENLLAGPFAGEFGWELMQWQGFVRRRRPHYKQVHVLTYPGRDYLYEGCTVHAHQIDLKGAGYGYGHLYPAVARPMAQRQDEEVGLRDYDIFGTHLLCTQYHRRFWRQDFRLFEQPSPPSGQYDVVFHFRSVQKIGPDQAKNYPVTLADELATRCLDHGLRIGCIGHPDYSYAPRNSVDHRRIDLQQTPAAISSAPMGAAGNSGRIEWTNGSGQSVRQTDGDLGARSVENRLQSAVESISCSHLCGSEHNSSSFSRVSLSYDCRRSGRH